MESKTSKSMGEKVFIGALLGWAGAFILMCMIFGSFPKKLSDARSEEHTSELQSQR